MNKIAKEQRRAVRRRIRQWRERIMNSVAPGTRARLAPLVNRLDMYLVDHGVIRLIYPNRHRLGAQAWRSGQPAPSQIAKAKQLGVRTVINLRGERFSGSYWLEREACQRHGLRMVDYHMRSRAAPSKAELLGVRELLKAIEYPVLIHCKAGADRAGLMSVLYLHLKEGLPIATARSQLSWKYGHLRLADTGILDHFFETYLAHDTRTPISFFDWVERHYDPDELKKTFRASRWATFYSRYILRRE